MDQVAQAQTPTQDGPAMHREYRGRSPGLHSDPLVMAVDLLNPTADQKQQIASLLEGTRQQHQLPMGPDAQRFIAMNNPGDPGYASAVEEAKAMAAKMVQMRSDLDVQIYALLSAEQKAKLPQVLNEMQAKFAAHRGEWRKP